MVIMTSSGDICLTELKNDSKLNKIYDGKLYNVWYILRSYVMQVDFITSSLPLAPPLIALRGFEEEDWGLSPRSAIY